MSATVADVTDNEIQVTLTESERVVLLLALHNQKLITGQVAGEAPGTGHLTPTMGIFDSIDQLVRKLGGDPSKPDLGLGSPPSPSP